MAGCRSSSSRLARRGWGDPALAVALDARARAALSTRGQIRFDDRLVPQFQQVAGGMFTVRGYEQSIVAGDSVVIGSAEYRFHLPRMLDPGPTRRSCR